MRNEHRVAIVTGGGQGIGKVIAARLLEKGVRVVIAEVDRQVGTATERELRRKGAVLFVPTDVAREASVRRMVRTAVRRFGRVDILVNNAAISRRKPVTRLLLQEWNLVLAVNLTGPFLCAKHAAPYLRKTRGCIVNIASTRAFMSEPDTEAYSASKGGLCALTHALAMSLGPDVRVNCISPGWIEASAWRRPGRRNPTPLTEADHTQHPAGRVGTPDDIAALALFLASDRSEFITGANIVADGGMTRKMIYV